MIFFVVYINPKDYSEKIYYATLTPVKIRELLEACEWEQKTKRITLEQFPNDPQEKIEIFARINNRDLALIEFYVQCFDRPAFRDAVRIEGNMDHFGSAIGDTILALNTGLLQTRDGHRIAQEQGKSAVRNPLWRHELDEITEALWKMQNRLEEAKRNGEYQEWGSGRCAGYYFQDYRLAEWFDWMRIDMLNRLNGICKEVGIVPLKTDLRTARW